jgi:hypothetical protein
MKNRIETLLNKVGQVMQNHLSNHDFAAVTRLSVLLSNLQQLQIEATQLDERVSEIEALLVNEGGKNLSVETLKGASAALQKKDDFSFVERSAPSTLRIEIDWKANRKDREYEVIQMPKAADGMIEFLRRTVEQLGPDILQKLARMRVNRGPLISKKPSIDFLNSAQGRPYSNKPLPGTEYFVLTHSQTSQKASDIERISRVLGFLPGSVAVREVPRAESYGNILADLLS